MRLPRVLGSTNIGLLQRSFCFAGILCLTYFIQKSGIMLRGVVEAGVVSTPKWDAGELLGRCLVPLVTSSGLLLVCRPSVAKYGLLSYVKTVTRSGIHRFFGFGLIFETALSYISLGMHFLILCDVGFSNWLIPTFAAFLLTELYVHTLHLNNAIQRAFKIFKRAS